MLPYRKFFFSQLFNLENTIKYWINGKVVTVVNSITPIYKQFFSVLIYKPDKLIATFKG